MVSGPCFTSRMNDDALIRLSNLKALNLTPKDLSERVGNRVSYWSDLLRGQKSFGEKLARKIEEQLSIPRGSLDTADADEPIPSPSIGRPDAERLAEALILLTKALQKADKNSRIALAPLLASMANDPEDAANKSHLILTLLAGTRQTAPTVHHASTSHLTGELGRLDLGGKEKDEQRDRAAASGSKG